MDNHELWEIMSQTWDVLSSLYEPIIEESCLENGISSQEWGLLLSVYKFEPDATSTPDLLVRDPYTAAEVYIERLEKGEQDGYLRKTRPGRFRLTESGRELVLGTVKKARQLMAEIDLDFTSEETQRLVRYMDRLVQASLYAPSPPDPWLIRLSYKLMPEHNPVLPFIEQSLTCLSAYRADAQLASWGRTGISATALETVTLLWNGEANSYDSICECLAHRGHDCQVYTGVLQELSEQGYVGGTEENIWITAAGRIFRSGVEADTESLFFKPWSSLTEEEKNELASFLERMKEILAIKES
ncbi:MAG: MarR family winged helix-turn-helix transcriptional regulator [Anaerolineales bacterium]|jgi:DNA-binding MarR family transcriptional regulator